MNEFRETLYESLLFSFGKILAQYNTFAQGAILNEVGREVIEYLKKNGYDYDKTGTVEDIQRLMNMFIENGFADLEVISAEHGDKYIWNNLYGVKAYNELQKITDNPFLSCPLNASVHYVAGKYGKVLKLHSQSFDPDACSAISEEEIVDKETEINDEGFDPLVIENKRLLEISEKQNEELKKALAEVKQLQELLPICANCRKVRDEKGYWNQIEEYIESHTDSKFTHGICHECEEELYGDEEWYQRKRAKK
ncbi:MAG: hypothetical protein GQ534_00810 [Candidatus Delongbacteria bacterium]|nr:hypothetical protein [Candidatus Delongbacteria bacterium]